MFLGLDPECEIVGEASNGVEALAQARKLRPDVVLMDLLMPVMGGIEATVALHRELPGTQVIALTSVVDDTPITDVIRAGANGYLLKDAKPDELSKAIRAAAAGQAQLVPQATAALLREMRAVPQGPEVLTERETQVLSHVALGQANKEIARALNITEKTVKTHISNILAKLEVSSRTQAALYATRIPSASRSERPSPIQTRAAAAPTHPAT